MKSIKAEAGIKVSIAALTLSVLIIIHYQSPGFFPKMWTVVTGRNVKYALATFIGKFPSIALEVIVGHDVMNYKKNMGGYQL